MMHVLLFLLCAVGLASANAAEGPIQHIDPHGTLGSSDITSEAELKRRALEGQRKSVQWLKEERERRRLLREQGAAISSDGSPAATERRSPSVTGSPLVPPAQHAGSTQPNEGEPLPGSGEGELAAVPWGLVLVAALIAVVAGLYLRRRYSRQ